MQPTIVFSKRKTLCIQISLDKGLIVKAPLRTSQSKIQELLLSKQKWIESKLKLVQERKEATSDQYLPLQDKILLFGEYFDKPQFINTKAKSHKFWLQNLDQYLTARIPQFASAIGVTYSTIKFRKFKSKWGSCSSKGELSFNIYLAKCPKTIIDYVAIHELCHRLEMNHSKRFWNHVERYYPEWKKVKKWFKTHGHAIMKD